ncbi:MAG: GNAT family N-acetyltransferase [Rhizomicrobium sp.]
MVAHRITKLVNPLISLAMGDLYRDVEVYAVAQTEAGLKSSKTRGFLPVESEGFALGGLMKLPMLKAPRPTPRVIVAANAEHLNMVAFIRGATFGAEQHCPYFEEFDGNDHCAMHLIGMVENEPAATLRVRFFAGFAKLERLAVLQRFRQSGISTVLMHEAISICRRKGYVKLYGQSQERLVGFYGKHGFQPMHKNAPIVFSDHAYVEIEADITPCDEPITIKSDPYLIIRPEGRWDELGVLDRSAARPATNPI